MLKKEGPGWLLAMDLKRGEYSFLIGGENWSTELNMNEWNSLVPIINDLINEINVQKNTLMKEENICLEIEREAWWACLDGTEDSWSLKLILTGDKTTRRGVEMFWPNPAAQAIAREMRSMWDSYQ